MEKVEALTSRMDTMFQMMDKKLETNKEYQEWLQLRSRNGSYSSGSEVLASAEPDLPTNQATTEPSEQAES